ASLVSPFQKEMTMTARPLTMALAAAALASAPCTFAQAAKASPAAKPAAKASAAPAAAGMPAPKPAPELAQLKAFDGTWSWEGDKMVYTGEGSMMGEKMQARDTFTRSADGASFKHASEAQTNGQWTSMGEETCHRAAAPASPKK